MLGLNWLFHKLPWRVAYRFICFMAPFYGVKIDYHDPDWMQCFLKVWHETANCNEKG